MTAALDRLREAGERYAVAKTKDLEIEHVRDVSLGDSSLFELSIGKRVLRKDLVPQTKETIPVYSSNVRTPFGYVQQAKVVQDVSRPSIIWSIDGNLDFNLIPAEVSFDITDHTGRVQVHAGVSIDSRFLVHEMRYRINEQNMDRSFGRL